MVTFKVQDYIETDDELGGITQEYQDVYTGEGYLDLLSGTNQNQIQNATIEQSTHVLICDYFENYQSKIKDKMYVVLGGRRYLITYVDDPVQAHDHLEIYLKYVSENE